MNNEELLMQCEAIKALLAQADSALLQARVDDVLHRVPACQLDALDMMLNIVSLACNESADIDTVELSEPILAGIKQLWDVAVKSSKFPRAYALSKLWGRIRAYGIDTRQFGTFGDFVDFLQAPIVLA